MKCSKSKGNPFGLTWIMFGRSSGSIAKSHPTSRESVFEYLELGRSGICPFVIWQKFQHKIEIDWTEPVTENRQKFWAIWVHCWTIHKSLLLNYSLNKNGLRLASSGPFGPLLARSGYPGQDASFCNNPMVMICTTVNALTLLETILYKFGRISATENDEFWQICVTRNALMQLKTILCKFWRICATGYAEKVHFWLRILD